MDVPDIDYKGRPYTDAQKQRIQELGNDPVRGLIPHEGEAGLAAEETHGLQLQRYRAGDLEFLDQNGTEWDVISPPSVGSSGKPAFRLNQVIASLKSHFLKGNVILDFGRLNGTDAATLRTAIGSLNRAEKRGRTIVYVRE